MSRHRITGACVLALAAFPAGHAAAAGPAVTISSLRVITADTRRPVAPPYRRDRAYAYIVRYRVTGTGTITVRRRAVLRTAGGVLIARVAPPDGTEESGEFFASARIPIGRHDPQSVYVLGYVIEVRGAGARRDRATRVLRMDFR